MELVWSSDDLVIAGQPYTGFPILLWDSMESCVVANQFFRHYLLRGAIGSKKSWPSTGRALYDFFSFLQAHELEWRDVDRGEAKSLVAAYRDFCLRACKPGPDHHPAAPALHLQVLRVRVEPEVGEPVTLLPGRAHRQARNQLPCPCQC